MEELVSHNMSEIMTNSNLTKTLKLSYYLETEQALHRALVERFRSAVFIVLARLETDQPLFDKVSRFTQYSEFSGSTSSKLFVAEIKTMLETIKKY